MLNLLPSGNIESYMSAHVLLFFKRVDKKMRNARFAEHFISFFETSLINSVIQEREF